MPEDMTERLDKMVDGAAEHLNSMREKLREAAGDRPWGSVKLNPQEKMERFVAAWDDVAVWQEAIEDARMRYNLPEGIIFPKRLIKESIELAERFRESQGA